MPEKDRSEPGRLKNLGKDGVAENASRVTHANIYMLYPLGILSEGLLHVGYPTLVMCMASRS